MKPRGGDNWQRLLLGAIMVLTSIVCCHARRHVEALPTVSEVVAGYENIDSVRSRMRASGLHSVEGLWQFPDDGAQIAIERIDAAGNAPLRYRLVVIRSPRRSILPGTVMGLMAPTSKKNVFAATIYTATQGSRRLTAQREFTLKLSDDARLTMTPNHSLRVRVNFWRLIPYLSNTIALRLQPQNNTPADLDGCVRLFPKPTSGLTGPRYL